MQNGGRVKIAKCSALTDDCSAFTLPFLTLSHAFGNKTREQCTVEECSAVIGLAACSLRAASGSPCVALRVSAGLPGALFLGG